MKTATLTRHVPKNNKPESRPNKKYKLVDNETGEVLAYLDKGIIGLIKWAEELGYTVLDKREELG